MKGCSRPTLAPAAHMNCFIAGDRTPSSPEETKMLAWAHPTFDGQVILFQNIEQWRDRSAVDLSFYVPGRVYAVRIVQTKPSAMLG
jgi:hypothetical protein